MSNDHTETQKGYSIIELWNLFLRYNKFIIITTLTFFILSIIYAWFIVTPDYISHADVMIQVEQDTSSTNDPNYDLVNAFRLIDTVAELMEKEVILMNAMNRLENLGYENLTVKYLRDGLIVTSSSTSYFINVSFVDENTLFSKEALDALIDAVIEETNVVDAYPVLTDKIRRTSFASDAIYYSPNKIVYSIVGFVIGFSVSVSYVLIKEAFSSKFRSKDDIENTLNTQVLGIIPLMEIKEKKNGKKK